MSNPKPDKWDYWTVDVCEGNPTLEGFHTWHTGLIKFADFDAAAEFARETYEDHTTRRITPHNN